MLTASDLSLIGQDCLISLYRRDVTPFSEVVQHIVQYDYVHQVKRHGHAQGDFGQTKWGGKRNKTNHNSGYTKNGCTFFEVAYHEPKHQAAKQSRNYRTKDNRQQGDGLIWVIVEVNSCMDNSQPLKQQKEQCINQCAINGCFEND